MYCIYLLYKFSLMSAISISMSTIVVERSTVPVSLWDFKVASCIFVGQLTIWRASLSSLQRIAREVIYGPAPAIELTPLCVDNTEPLPTVEEALTKQPSVHKPAPIASDGS